MNLSKQDYMDILDFYNINYSKNLPINLLRKLVEDKLAIKICSCIKKVKEKYNDKDEARSIAICNNSVIQKKNLKIYGFSCKKKKTLKALQSKPKGNKVLKNGKKLIINKTKKKKNK
tara:strand:- start:464 stop:814 length:351 start_codon:yes stop_codon:yes gene_type:complete